MTNQKRNVTCLSIAIWLAIGIALVGCALTASGVMVSILGGLQ